MLIHFEKVIESTRNGVTNGHPSGGIAAKRKSVVTQPPGQRSSYFKQLCGKNLKHYFVPDFCPEIKSDERYLLGDKIEMPALYGFSHSMSETVPSPFLVGITQEEVTANETCALRCYKVNSFQPSRLRQCHRILSHHESGSNESDCASSGDEWQPPPSATSSTLSNEVQTPNLPPSAASSVPPYKLNTTSNMSSSINMSTTEVLINPTTSEIQYPKCEADELSCEKNTDERRPVCVLELRNFVCEICGKGFKWKTNMNRHIDTIHKAVRPFACEFCGRNFAEAGHLRSHIDRIHKTVRPFACEICGRNFAETGDLKNHIDRVHKKLRNFECELCGKAFALRAILDKHIDAIHKELRNFVCEICGKGFSWKANMIRHIDAIHKDLRENTCDSCGKVFERSSQLKRHVDCVHKYHVSRRPERENTCEFCGKTFTQVGTLTRHVDHVHKHLRQHICGFCGKAFGTKHDVKRHVHRVHQKEQTHTCDICNKDFSCKVNLKRHADCNHNQSSEKMSFAPAL
uniref:Zinc finger protein 479 n=3 Tax=Schistocephalus solidus TaxID=70667 RepID=A0A0X3Q2V8_SCHSO